jgi:hypothetical protein
MNLDHLPVLSKLCCVWVWLCACSSGKTTPATQAIVTVDSDIAVAADLARVETEVFDEQGKRVDHHTFKLAARDPGSDEVALPFSFGVVKRGSERFQLVVTGYGPNADDALVAYTGNVAFQNGKTLTLNVFLSALCSGSACDDGETCYAAAQGGTAAGDCGPISDADVTVKPPAGGSAGHVGSAGRGGSAARAGSGNAGEPGEIAGNASQAGKGESGRAAAGRGGRSGGGAGGCSPSCDGKTCGPDGCGGQCGTCKNTETCAAGSCVCNPSCAGKTCGPDGCGGQCGVCSGTDVCKNNSCVCTPDCTGKLCGSDGCGGTCAPGCNASAGATCTNGTCKFACGAESTACNCGIAPSDATPGKLYTEPLCASGVTQFNGCTDDAGNPSLCFLNGNPVSYQWGEICDCSTTMVSSP